MLDIKNAYKAYGDKKILDNFNLALPKSGAVAVLGPSGCGKTTLMRVIAGLEGLDAGEIIMPQDAKISMVFQEDRLLPALDVRGNVMAALKGGGQDLKLCDECLLRCEILDAAKQRVSSLSGGMKRRVAIARAMAFGGDILLLDEPFKGLDDELKKKVMEFVLEKRDNSLIVFITHDREETRLADCKVIELSGAPLRVLEEAG